MMLMMMITDMLNPVNMMNGKTLIRSANENTNSV
jgi:hypothetical protein